MVTAAPHVKLLRQLADARDDYLSGALDLAWDGGESTIFLVFGQPTHMVFEAGGERLEGGDALEALQRGLPQEFAVGEWRRTMSPSETLHCSVDDLSERFAGLAGAGGGLPDNERESLFVVQDDDSPDLGFGLADFPLLPEGEALWAEGPAEASGLSGRLAGLPAALVTLVGPRLRAAGVAVNGALIDAVWVDTEDHVRGDTAAAALLGAQHDTLVGYGLDSDDIAEALPMLWRFPAGDPIDIAWLDPAGLVTALGQNAVDAAVVIDAAIRGVALFREGILVAVYSAEQRVPTRSAQTLLDLLAQPQGTVVVRQRPGLPRGHRRAAPDTVAPPGPSTGASAVPPADNPQVRSNAGGSSVVDFDAVKRELAGIGRAWFGDQDSAPVTQLIEDARPTIEDFVAAIDAIRTLSLPGHDPAAVESMAHEMYQQAAERLCGA